MLDSDSRFVNLCVARLSDLEELLVDMHGVGLTRTGKVRLAK